MADDPTPEPDPTPSPAPTPDPPADPPEIDWKAQSRKHESEKKRLLKERDDLAKQIAEREDANKTEQERAIENARKEAAEAAKSETSKDYRGKILNAEIRAQAAGKFANPALAVKLLDLDLEDAFDSDGEIKTDLIETAIGEYLDKEPYLKADPHNGRPSGDDDAGRGRAGGKDLEDLTPAEHLKLIQGRA